MSAATVKLSNFGPALRPVPAGFAEHAPTASDMTLRTMFSAGPTTIARWRKETGIPRPPELARGSQCPPNFAEIATGMTVRQAAERLGRPVETVRKWFVVAGVTPRVASFRPTGTIKRTEGDASVAGQAAQYLRQTFASVHRADIRLKDGSTATWGSERGLPDKGRGQYFVSGKGAMPAADMIELARAHGFRAFLA